MCHYDVDGYLYYRMLSVHVRRGCIDTHFASSNRKIGIIFALLWLVYSSSLRVFSVLHLCERVSVVVSFLATFCSVYARACVHFVSFDLRRMVTACYSRFCVNRIWYMARSGAVTATGADWPRAVDIGRFSVDNHLMYAAVFEFNVFTVTLALL